MSAGSGGRVIQWEEGWENIKKNGIGKVQSMIEKDGHGEFKPQEYVVLYTIIYKMCTQKAPFSYSKELYDGFNHSFEKYLSSVSLPAIKEKNGADKIKEMVRRWKNHKLMKKWMVSFFTYLNRYFVKRHNLEPLDRVATARFCELIYNEVKGKATEILLELITKDRNGEEVDRGLLKECIQIYVEMGLDANNGYVNDFQKPFLASTALYYSREATEWLAHDSCPEYLRKAEARFAEEAQRQRDFLHSSSESGLNKVLFQTMLADHQTELLNKENTGLKALLARHSKDDLGRLYKLYHTEPSSLEPIAEIFKTHVTEAGMLLIKKATESKDTKMFVVEIIKLHQLYYDLVTDSFQGHAVFHRALKVAFETVANGKVNGQGLDLLLSSYADICLRKGGIKQSLEEQEAMLENIVRLFTYLINKDLFSEYYRKHLSKRLLLQRSASTDAEKSMIGKLKIRCGAQFTSKLEGMINDMRNAKDEQNNFSKFLQERRTAAGPLLPYEFTVQTLTTGFWPTQQSVDVKLPRELARGLTTFKLFYDSKTQNRKLQWLHPLGSVTLTREFKSGRRDLIVSTVQAAILMYFNNTKVTSIEAMTKALNLDPPTIKAQLRSLVSGQFKVLLKKPAEGYNPKHLIRVNNNFAHQMRVIRIPNAVQKTTKKERDAAEGAVQEDRKHAIEANIVRVMKSRKTLTHQQLMSEVSQQLMQYFKPDPRQIKKRVEDLIQREYLERDKEKGGVYHYLA